MRRSRTPCHSNSEELSSLVRPVRVFETPHLIVSSLVAFPANWIFDDYKSPFHWLAASLFLQRLRLPRAGRAVRWRRPCPPPPFDLRSDAERQRRTTPPPPPLWHQTSSWQRLTNLNGCCACPWSCCGVWRTVVHVPVREAVVVGPTRRDRTSSSGAYKRQHRERQQEGGKKKTRDLQPSSYSLYIERERFTWMPRKKKKTSTT